MNKNLSAVEIIESGKKMALAGIGGAVGAVIEAYFGPVGVAITGAAGGIAQQAVEMMGDFVDRQLSDREKVRLGAGFALTFSEIEKRLERGEVLRNDDFFIRSDEKGRSKSEEVLEGIFRKIKEGHEEKKAPFIAKIFSNVCFDQTVSISEANHVIQVVSNLTYRQLCILGYSERYKAPRDFNVFPINFDELGKVDFKKESLKQEAFELVQLGLLEKPTELGGRETEAVLQTKEVRLEELVRTTLGQRYFELMGLAELPVPDVMECGI